MPIQISSDENKFLEGKFIPRVTLLKMLQNFVDKTYKKKNGNPHKVDKDNDSHAVWYSKKEIDLLFAANSNPGDTRELGLRIYFGVHTNSEIESRTMPGRPPGYMDQHTGILICTRGEGKDIEELLNDNDSISVHQRSSVSQTGYEEGQICPPPTCGKLSSQLKP
jgi:hypothetical protein